jgi:hypothetical protein
MPPWLTPAMGIRSNEGLYLPMTLVRLHAFGEQLVRQPAGIWITEFGITSDGG